MGGVLDYVIQLEQVIPVGKPLVCAETKAVDLFSAADHKLVDADKEVAGVEVAGVIVELPVIENRPAAPNNDVEVVYEGVKLASGGGVVDSVNARIEGQPVVGGVIPEQDARTRKCLFWEMLEHCPQHKLVAKIVGSVPSGNEDSLARML